MMVFLRKSVMFLLAFTAVSGCLIISGCKSEAQKSFEEAKEAHEEAMKKMKGL